jgi:1,4-alpha-glucan branching enzyme
MGAVPFDGGVTFRVWAPHAEGLRVVGSWDDWAPDTGQLARDDDGRAETWSADVPGAASGDEYRFIVDTPDGERWRLDPYARQLTNSVGNAVVYDHRAFDWGVTDFSMPHRDDLVLYELHVGTFTSGEDGGDFDGAIERLDYLRELGVSAVQIMPPLEFAGDLSWGYNPAHLFAIETSYGGPDGFKRFVRAAHEHGIAVIVDVVYNHLGPSDLDLWRWDGWGEGDRGGIYFYGDDRADTPWGATRPDYGRGEVRTFLRDSALTWLEDYRCDGLRFDATVWIRALRGPDDDPPVELPEGRSFLVWVNDEIRARQPWKVTIAEDLQDDPSVTTPSREGGLGFDAQWDAGFLWRVRTAIEAPTDPARSLPAIVEAIEGGGRGPAHGRVIYTESHDDVANGKSRVPETISPGDAGSWWAKKRATIGTALVLTAPGIPMLFQGQELLEDRWWDDTVALDWAKVRRHEGILRLHRDLIGLRRGGAGRTLGLRGPHVSILRADDAEKLLAFHRWRDRGPGDDTVVVVNLADRPVTDVRIGMPAGGRWRVRLNSDSPVYATEFGGMEAFDTDADGEPRDGQPQSALLSVGPYAVIILSQDP